MNTIIVALLVLPLLFAIGVLYRHYVEIGMKSIASGLLVMGLIFARTGLARISGGEVPESTLLAHPDNDWLRYIVTSEWSYGILHFLFLCTTVWFFIESKQKRHMLLQKEYMSVRKDFKKRLAHARRKAARDTTARLVKDKQVEMAATLKIAQDKTAEDLKVSQDRVAKDLKVSQDTTAEDLRITQAIDADIVKTGPIKGDEASDSPANKGDTKEAE